MQGSEEAATKARIREAKAGADTDGSEIQSETQRRGRAESMIDGLEYETRSRQAGAARRDRAPPKTGEGRIAESLFCGGLGLPTNSMR